MVYYWMSKQWHRSISKVVSNVANFNGKLKKPWAMFVALRTWMCSSYIHMTTDTVQDTPMCQEWPHQLCEVTTPLRLLSSLTCVCWKVRPLGHRAQSASSVNFLINTMTYKRGQEITGSQTQSSCSPAYSRNLVLGNVLAMLCWWGA